MPTYQLLTDRTLAHSSAITPTTLIHIVYTGDPSQNLAGSSYKAELGQLAGLFSGSTFSGSTFSGGSGNCIADLYVTNIHGCSPITIYDSIKSSGSTVTNQELAFSYGIRTSATTSASTALNYETRASGIGSLAQGANTWASNTASHAEGAYTIASGVGSHAEGGYNIGSTIYSGGTASGRGSHAEGAFTIASGDGSHAEGVATLASGRGSHAEGGYYDGGVFSGGTAIGRSSHAEGLLTTSEGTGSHSEGRSTLSYGAGSHAEGSGTTSFGQYSHSEGKGTYAIGNFQSVVGFFNSTGDTTEGAFIIGNGSDNVNRSNLLFAAGNEVNVSGKTKTINLQVTSGATPGYVLTVIDSSGNTQWIDLGSNSNELDPVLTITGVTASTVNNGDRFLISGGTGIWSGKDNQIAEYTGAGPTDFSYYIPVLDDVVFVTDTLTTLRFNGTSWISWRGTAILQNGNSLTTSVNIGSNNNRNLTFRTSGQTRMLISGNTGNVYIGTGTTLPIDQRLLIDGNIKIADSRYYGYSGGTGTTITGRTLNISHSAVNTHSIVGGPNNESITFGPTNRIFIQAGEVPIIGALYVTPPSGPALLGGNNTSGFQIFNAFALQANTTRNGIIFQQNISWNGGTGTTSTSTINSVKISPTANMVTGTTNGNLFVLDPTINYTGGTLNLRGLYYNPTISATTTAFTETAIETVRGNVLLNTLSGNTGIGTILPLTKLDIAAFNTTTAVNNTLRFTDTDTVAGTQFNGKIEFYSSDTDGVGVKSYIGGIINALSEGSLIFATTGTTGSLSGGTIVGERMRIDSNGNVGIGTSNPSSTLHVNSGDFVIDDIAFRAVNNELTPKGVLIIPTANNGSYNFNTISGDTVITATGGRSLVIGAGGVGSGFRFSGTPTPTPTSAIITTGAKLGIGAAFYASSEQPSTGIDVDTNGRFRAIGSTASAGALHYSSDGTLTTNTSDIRLKEKIEPLTNSLEKILQLSGITYNWIGIEGKRIGFIAQEVEKVIPELVFTNNNTEDEIKGIHQDNLTAVLVEAIKEQQKIIEELKIRISNLES